MQYSQYSQYSVLHGWQSWRPFQSITVWSGSKSVSHGPESLMEETGVVKAEDEEEETVYRLQYFSFQVHFNEMYILLDQTLNFKPKDAVIDVE